VEAADSLVLRKLILPVLLCAAIRPAAGQIDPERRQLLELGFDQAIDGRGPLAAYAYYYLNEPDFFAPDRTLRLIVAPGYADSELGLAKVLGPKTSLGIGLAGGAFADSYDEIRQDTYYRNQSFAGDGAKAALSLYHDFPPFGPLPLAGVLRVGGRYATFSKDRWTDSTFSLPKAQSEVDVRAGLRLGGKEPMLRPNLAMEVSAWYGGRSRLDPTTYGYDGDRSIEPNSQLFWGRGMLIHNKPSSAERFIVVLNGGTSIRADRFSAYQLGGDLPMAAEFPLSLPGYYYEEISAKRFALLNSTYIVPLSRDKTTWTASATASTAMVDYIPGFEQRGKSHTGLGLGAAYLSHSKAWQLLGGYGYGINAARGHGNGGHTVGLLMQFDFRRVQVPFFHPLDPNYGLDHILQSK
jgi:hypothetical protein